MTIIKKKNFDKPDELVDPGDKLKFEIIDLGAIKIQRVTAEAGWKWSEHLKPVVKTENCEKHHLIHLVSGRLATRMASGEESRFKSGDSGSIPPGHDSWVDGEEPAVWLEIIRK